MKTQRWRPWSDCPRHIGIMRPEYCSIHTCLWHFIWLTLYRLAARGAGCYDAMNCDKGWGSMTELNRHTSKLTRVPTGVAGFDRILHGGFFEGGLYIIAGPPGAGKTILGNQLCFHHVASGGRAIFMTMLTESHSRMLAHLGPLSFFDPASIGRTLHYLS